MSVLLAGVVLGLAGSAHCVVMCGPLVAAVAPRGRRAVLHHAGRGAVYMLLGTAAGAAGAGMSAAGWGRWWAFLLAAILLLQAASRTVTVPAGIGGSISRATRTLSRIVREWSLRHPATGAFGVGAMNGLLPCGLVYAATAASAGLGAFGASVSFMAGFALGTMPLLAVSAASLDWTRRRAPALNRFTPVLLVLMAVLLIARGLQVPGAPPHLH